jgi:hypothetical protein
MCLDSYYICHLKNLLNLDVDKEDSRDHFSALVTKRWLIVDDGSNY